MNEIWLNLPKSELHVHLKGAMPIEVFAHLLNKYSAKEALRDAPGKYKTLFRHYNNIRPFLSPREWSVAEVTGLFRYKTFNQFLATWLFTMHFFREVSDVRRLVSSVLNELRAQKVVYAEITISPIEYLTQGIPLSGIKRCLEEAGDCPGIRVQWIVDLVRNTGSEGAQALLEQVIDMQCEKIVGITLGGDEQRYPPDQFARVYATARDHGLRLTVHAGETLGPKSIWAAIKLLGAERIGHGVRAIEDPMLVKYLADHQIPLEICPTSNLRTGLFPSYASHPVKALFDAGIPLTINSDDPTFFGTTLSQEYAHVQAAGIPTEGVFNMVKNGFRFAFLPKNDIDRYLEFVDREWELQSS